MFSEIVVFHALILLMNSDYDSSSYRIYEKEFMNLIKRDFNLEEHVINQKLIEDAEQTSKSQTQEETKENEDSNAMKQAFESAASYAAKAESQQNTDIDLYLTPALNEEYSIKESKKL